MARLRVDVSIARGLDYYTGTVYETFLDDLRDIGSCCSGGRYDDLASLYTKQDLPGVGASLGVDRLLAAMEELGLVETRSATADVLAELMERVVTSGTGTNAAVQGVRIAGKTGTAEVPDQAPHSWFIGFGPVQPEEGTSTIAFAIVVESGGVLGDEATGGTVAAPIAAQLMTTWLAQQGG